MINGRGGRILPILAAVLMLLALSVSLAVILLRVPEPQRFSESLLSARMASAEGNKAVVRRELLRASRYAVSAANWKSLLVIAADSIPEDPAAADYRLFTTLAGRGLAALPGNEDLAAYWVWGLLRSGDARRAGSHIDSLKDNRWSSLRAEVRLEADLSTQPEGSLASLQALLETSPDPDFYSQTAQVTESAELTYDAALLYMLTGRPEEAYREAFALMSGKRRWNSPEAEIRNQAAAVSAAIAHDAGERNQAIIWLEAYLEEAGRSRTITWEALQLTGDLYWERYLISGDADDRDGAAQAWRGAVDLLRAGDSLAGFPDGVWKLWLNLAVLEQSDGRILASRDTLSEALTLFPDRSEVKAAWARRNIQSDPALARRLVGSAGMDRTDPVLAITAIKVNPEAVTPRLYESRLWELFDEITLPASRIEIVDRRMLTTFLLNYMASRRNMSSIDVAVDRYRKTYPDESWILSWRLAADSSRDIGLLDIVSMSPDGISSYEEFRFLARSDGNWRALYDSALFAVLVSGELGEAARQFPGGGAEFDPGLVEPAVLSILEQASRRADIADTPLYDRLVALVRSRNDLEETVRKLRSRGRSGRILGAKARKSLELKSSGLLEQALEDLDTAISGSRSISDTDLSEIYYLQAFALKQLGRHEEAVIRARSAVERDPDNARASELIENTNEVSS